MKKNRIIQDMVAIVEKPEWDKKLKVDTALDDICMAFDLQHPLWYEKNYKEMEKFNNTTFHQDHFMEKISFDYLEIEIIEDDKKKPS